MKLGIDIDGCLADFNTAYGNLIIETTGVCLFPDGWSVNPNFPTTWNWELDGGYTKEQVNKVWEVIVKSNKFWETLKPYADTKDVIKELNGLAKRNNEVYFLTHRMGKNAKLQTEKWLYDLGMSYPTVILTGEKAPLLSNLGIKFFVDDKLATMNEVTRLLPKGNHFYLIDRPYNQSGRIAGVKSLPSVMAALEIAELVTAKESK